MNTLIKAEAYKVVKEVKGLEVIQATAMKTKTKLEVQFTQKESGFQEGAADDINLLKLGGEKMSGVLVTVEGADAIGRMINRTVGSFSKIGIETVEMAWDATAGVIEVKGDFTCSEFPYLIEVFNRLTRRASASMGWTHHPMTLFDLKQAIGLVNDVKQEVEGAQNLMDWFNVRELTILDEQSKVKKTPKTMPGRTTKEAGLTSGEAVQARIGSEKNALPKGKAIKTASLANLS